MNKFMLEIGIKISNHQKTDILEKTSNTSTDNKKNKQTRFKMEHRVNNWNDKKYLIERGD